MKEQTEYLNKIQEIVYNKILVSKNILKDKQFTPSYRVEITSEEQIIDHHIISSNEIVFDLDFKNYILCYKHAKLIISTLEERKIPYYIYSTGGKGIHIHIYFDKIEITSDEIKKLFTEALRYNFTWSHLREFIFNIIIEESGITKAYIGKYIDTQKIKFNDLEESTVLIRACGGRNQKLDEVTGAITTTYKTWIPIEEFKDKKIKVTNIANVKYPEHIESFKISQHELGQCLKDYIEQAKQNKMPVLEKVKLSNGYTGLASVQKIIEGLSEGQRNEGAKILALALVLDDISYDKAELVMTQYANNCSQIGHSFTKSEAIGWYKWMKFQPTHFWNNEYVKKLGVWDKDTDEYYTLFKKDSLKVLKNKTLLSRIDAYLSKEIVGEKENRILIFLLLLSSKFKVDKEWNIPGDPKPQSIILSSLSASGKSYITKSILRLLGDEGIDFYSFSRMTGTVLNYFTDIDMTNKVLFVEELQGLDRDSNQLRLWISEGKLKLATVEKVEEGEETRNRLVIKESIGQPVFITGTAEDIIDEQMNNRSWLISLDISELQNKSILRYESDMARRRYESSSDELRLLKDALKELKPYHFIIPYLDYEILNIPTNDVRIRRDYKKFADLICCITLLFQRQRICVTDSEGKEYLISSIEDYEIAVRYSESVLSSTFSGLTAQQIWVLEQIKIQPWSMEFESADVQRLTNWSQSKTYNILSQLEEVGAITSTGKKPGSPTTYALNPKKVLVNLNLPSAEELLEKLEKNDTNFNFLKKYDFYYQEITKTGLFPENVIACIQSPIFKPIFRTEASNLSLFPHTINNINNDFIYSKSDKFDGVGEKIGSKNSLPPDVRPLELQNLSVLEGEISQKIAPNSFEIGEKTVKKTDKKSVLEFIGNSSEHMISESVLEQEFGLEVYDVIDGFCKVGILFKPKAGYIMKL